MTPFLPLPGPDSASKPGSRRVAIASVDIAGPYHCGGVGAAYHGLVLALAEAGHDVTVVYMHDNFHQGSLSEWTGYFDVRGIRFVHLPQVPPNMVSYATRKERSLRCCQWLREQPPFDVIHFPEWQGLGYYSLLARQQGLAFAGATICIGTHGSMRWNRQGDETLVSRSEDLVVDFMERKSVELADVVVSPSRYLLQWMRGDGWRLPERTYVAPNVLQPLETSSAPLDSSIRELVFFGRLDHRKGLPFFCDVIDRLQGLRRFQVTFLGSMAAVEGRRSIDYLRLRAAAWTIEPTFLTTFSRTQALEYLSGTGRLAVMPSRLDNSPCTVQECLQEHIPFLTSDRGGIPELVHPRDLARVSIPCEVDRWVTRLQEIIDFGQRPARPSQSVVDSRARWRLWHQSIPLAEPAGVNMIGEPPGISVCIAHHERPGQLHQMIESLRGQDYPRFEVILADDGSTSAETVSFLDSLRDDFAARGWQLLRQDNAGPGSARDRAARAAKGPYLLFADDDDILLPHTVQTFSRVAVHTGADAFACVLAEFEGEGAPANFSDAAQLLIPLGPALAAGLGYPEFGGTLYMLTRDCYFAAGGFSLDRDADEDWELLLNVVAQGFDLRVIPEPLVWYRKQPHSRSRADNRFTRNRSRLQIYEKLLPRELRDLAALAFSRLSNAPDAGSQKRLERVIQSLEKVRRLRAE